MRLPIVLASLLLLTACSEEVTAVTGTEMPFSIYSVFSPERDTQFVRVFPVEGTLTPVLDDGPLDARVTTRGVGSGEVRVWQDSVLQEANSQYTHVFWSPFRAEYGETYELEVVRSDEATTRAVAAVPPATEMVLLQPYINTQLTDPISPVLVKGDAPRLRKIVTRDSVRYRIRSGDILTGVFAFDYTAPITRSDEGWEINLNLGLENWKIWQAGKGNIVARSDIQLLGMEMRLHVVNEDWAPLGDATEEEVLAQPNVLWNVENGFGFVGAGYHQSIKWLPPPDILDAAGFGIVQ